MITREVTSKDRTPEVVDDENQLHRVWELNVLGKVLLLERYGSMCGWSQLKLKRNGKEVYRIVKPWGEERREEFFFNQSTRVYWGNRFSFIEYIEQIDGQIPAPGQFTQAGLSTRVERVYRDNLQKILAETSLGN